MDILVHQYELLKKLINMHILFDNEWAEYRKTSWVFNFFKITWDNEDPYPILSITFLNFTIQIDFTK